MAYTSCRRRCPASWCAGQTCRGFSKRHDIKIEPRREPLFRVTEAFGVNSECLIVKELVGLRQEQHFHTGSEPQPGSTPGSSEPVKAKHQSPTEVQIAAKTHKNQECCCLGSKRQKSHMKRVLTARPTAPR